MMDHSLPQLCSDDTCTGCGACASGCEKEAIRLLPNEEGFYRPQIDSSKCVFCGLCEKVCPVLNPLKGKSSYADSLVYAAWNKDEKVRAESSSGGAFSALADTVLEMDGVVCGAAYMNDMSVEHICIENKADLPKLRLSKYVQSYTGRVFRQIQKYARQGKTVLFCGTPCQTAGLISFLRKDYPNVYVCDFICHGVPSPYMYKRYLDWIESRYGKVVHVNFRHKKKGWYDALRVMTFKDGRQKAMKGKDAVISAYNPGWSNPNMYEDTLRVYPKILEEVKESGVKRLLIVGGAGSLFVKSGLRLVDTGTLPEAWLPGVKSMAKFFLETLVNEKELDWVFFSPAANLGNLTTGVRTGKFRLGKDDLIVDEKGESFISVEDYAMAMVDELEQENHHHERFTIGY